MLEGRSSIGRLGLFIHVTAGFGDVGFNGYWTLEMFCVQPIRIYAGVEICQIISILFWEKRISILMASIRTIRESSQAFCTRTSKKNKNFFMVYEQSGMPTIIEKNRGTGIFLYPIQRSDL